MSIRLYVGGALAEVGAKWALQGLPRPTFGVGRVRVLTDNVN